MKSMAILAAAASVFAAGSASAQDPSLDDLADLIGEWEGQSTFHFPLEPGRERLNETARATCGYILKTTYIQCDAAFTRADGRERTFRIHFNYNAEKQTHQVLFIYDNWPVEASYSIPFDEKENAFVAVIDYDPNGQPGEERIVWRVSKDEVSTEEYVRFAGEPDIRWRKSFDFVWRRKG